MPKPTKRTPPHKPTFATTPSKSLTPQVPKPYTTAPESLTPFLSTLPKSHIYLTSLDTHPRDFKRRLFAVPLLLNISLTVLLGWRLQHALPAYLGIIMSLFGYETPQKIDVRGLDSAGLLAVGGERALMFLGDFMLVRFVGMWPFDFFVGREGKASPVAWRRTVGFRDEEVVVRRSRRWAEAVFRSERVRGPSESDARAEELDKEKNEKCAEEWVELGKDSELFQGRVVPAVERAWVSKKTAYQMLDLNWDLHFPGMIEATALVDTGTNKKEEFRNSMFIYTEKWGWLVWEVYKEQEDDAQDEGTEKLQLVKNKLTAMGKENLFFRWIEIVQSETSQEGDFSVAKQKKAIGKVREEFERQGVHFDDFWTPIGGIETMPGLEIRS